MAALIVVGVVVALVVRGKGGHHDTAAGAGSNSATFDGGDASGVDAPQLEAFQTKLLQAGYDCDAIEAASPTDEASELGDSEDTKTVFAEFDKIGTPVASLSCERGGMKATMFAWHDPDKARALAAAYQKYLVPLLVCKGLTEQGVDATALDNYFSLAAGASGRLTVTIEDLEHPTDYSYLAGAQSELGLHLTRSHCS